MHRVVVDPPAAHSDDATLSLHSNIYIGTNGTFWDSPVVRQRESQELTLFHRAKRHHDAVPLQLSHRASMQVRLGHRLPLALLREVLRGAREATRGEETRVGVRVERAREGRPDVDHALHEGQVLVVAVGPVRRQGAEDVVELAGVTSASERQDSGGKGGCI